MEDEKGTKVIYQSKRGTFDRAKRPTGSEDITVIVSAETAKCAAEEIKTISTALGIEIKAK